MKGTPEQFAEGIRKMYASMAEQIVECVNKGEWFSKTTNITVNPEGEGPVIADLTFAGTTPEHAKKVQKAIAQAFTNLNE